MLGRHVGMRKVAFVERGGVRGVWIYLRQLDLAVRLGRGRSGERWSRADDASVETTRGRVTVLRSQIAIARTGDDAS